MANTKTTFERIEQKIEDIDYEAGSGNMHIPILGNLVPELFHQKPKELKKYFIVVKGRRYSIGEKLFATISEGDEVRITRSDDLNENPKMEIRNKEDGSWVEF